MKAIRIAALLVFAAVVLVTAVNWVRGFLAQDSCLDSGGSYQASSGQCQR